MQKYQNFAIMLCPLSFLPIFHVAETIDIIIFPDVSKFRVFHLFVCYSIGLLFNFLLSQLYKAIRAACCISSLSIQSLSCFVVFP